MAVHDDIGARLREDLRASEPGWTPRPDLAVDAISAGRRALRRRRLAAGAASVLAVSAVVLGGLALQGRSLDRTAPVPPADSGNPIEGDTRTPLDWASSLPLGAPPEVPYLLGVDLHLPSGQVVDLEGADAEIVGAADMGTVLLVENDGAKGTPFSSRYVVVSDAGETTDLPISTLAPVQEAAVSPDGALFAAHRAVVRLGDLTPIAAIPDNAELLISWTSNGITYSDHGGSYFLWQPGESANPIRLSGHPGVFLNGTEIGMRDRSGCSQVVRLDANGTTRVIYQTCDGNRLHTVSPNGRWAITRDLRLVDLRTGTVSSLDDASVDRLHATADSRWLSEEDVLLTITSPETASPITRAILVRCRLAENACERATEVLDVPVTQGNIGLP